MTAGATDGDTASAGASTAPLSKERVLRTAVALADAEGITGLTMRRLARELDAGAMSLYHHVRSKEELLDGMVDLVFAELRLPDTKDDWRAAMRAEAVSAREVLARHRWAIPLMESRTTPGPANLRHREAVTATLRTAGFSVRMATHANWLLNSYVYGHALQEAGLPFADATELGDMIPEVYLPQLPAEQYPYLHESATQLMAGDYDPADEFTYGLDLVLDALERARIADE
ncbi:TetR/AcrR family transcriptional regulator [Microcella daejeonensis]|uniref:TetR/AcrR family transcriptional regulator n=1 Tax=Microcella daejeonensis TaxID=2994971 RepID=UPI00226F7F9E|nr:TetR/AcrR family transcriptional regulator [Microcella daejeonensis]WAB83487.1 TetR/AcrR family transcriptional regulator [Microcella daejeonensis]